MSNLFNPIYRPLSLLFAVGAFALTSAVAAQEVQSLRGKPSSEMILNALSPSNPDAPAAPVVRRRGLSISNSESADTTAPAAEQKAPTQIHAKATAPMRPEPRALDLEIKFQFNSDQLTSDGMDVLDQLAAALKSEQLASARSVVLEGHADAKGSANYNQALSLKRAQATRNYLATRHGISAGKLRATGKGASELADPNNPEDEVNRRVRVILIQ